MKPQYRTLSDHIQILAGLVLTAAIGLFLIGCCVAGMWVILWWVVGRVG